MTTMREDHEQQIEAGKLNRQLLDSESILVDLIENRRLCSSELDGRSIRNVRTDRYNKFFIIFDNLKFYATISKYDDFLIQHYPTISESIAVGIISCDEALEYLKIKEKIKVAVTEQTRETELESIIQKHGKECVQEALDRCKQ